MTDEPTAEYSREHLIDLCERGVVPQEKWTNRDSESAHSQLGQAWVFLRAGCDFKIDTDMMAARRGDDDSVWVRIRRKGFAFFEEGDMYESDLFYLPTNKRLKDVDGEDWYL